MTFVEPTLWEHQKRALEAAAGHPEFAFFMEQGTGKTLTTITRMRQIFAEMRRPLRTLILCPAIVVKNWKREIETFSQCGRFVQTLEGPTPKRIKALKQGLEDGKRIFVTNIEALATCDGLLWETKERGKTKTKSVIDHGWEMIVFDEAHRIKDSRAASTKMAIKLGDKTYYKFALSGTPILQNEMDVWSIFRFLDGGESFGTNFMSFKREYFYDANAGMPQQRYFPDWQPKPGSAERIQELVYKRAFRVTKDECMDLPPLVYKRIDVALSPQQAKHYAEMKRDFITYLESGACVAQLAVTKALRLQQIVTGFVKLEDDTEISLDASPRLNALRELLSDRPKGAKTIVWAVFKHNYDQIARVCEKLGLSYTFLTGRETRAEKDQAELDFTKGSADVLIASPGAGGTGVNLVEADVAIWFSRNFRLEWRLQALARNHRGGSERHKSITVYDLCADGTCEPNVIEALDRKEDIASSILDWRNRV